MSEEASKRAWAAWEKEQQAAENEIVKRFKAAVKRGLLKQKLKADEK